MRKSLKQTKSIQNHQNRTLKIISKDKLFDKLYISLLTSIIQNKSEMNFKYDGFQNCPGCNNQIQQQKIQSHIMKCNKYPNTILKQISNIRQEMPVNELKGQFLQVQLIMAKERVAKFVTRSSQAQKNRKNEKDKIFDSDVFQIDEEQDEPPKKIVQMQIEKSSPVFEDNALIVLCSSCKRKFYRNFDRELLVEIFGCWHVECQPCINKYINSEYVQKGGQLKCPQKTCNNMIEEEQIKGLIGREKFEGLQIKAIRKMCNVNQCFKCKQQFDFVSGNAKDAPKKDNNGKALTSEHAQDYSINRFVCPNGGCKTEQCKHCQATPYHLGMTCKEYKARQLLRKCRYCDEPLTSGNASLTKIKALADICNSKQCQESAKMACQTINPCGHPCYGFKGEKKCLPCLKEQCAEKVQQLKGINGDQYCAVCYVEALSAAPCIKIGCGHIFHVKCLKKRFDIKWLTPRILFNFCLCPLCKKWIQVKPESELDKPSSQNKILYQKIQKMSIDRLKYQQLQKSDPKLTDKSSSYYGKPDQYAMAIYAYFMCYKCKNPYFGGRKNCAEVMNQGQNAAEGFDAKELVCANCCDIPIKDCPKHGKDFIEFKCKFCCSVAQWFCWGNTHFCQSCHKRQCSGDYVSKYTKAQLPQCKGPGGCPSGGNHQGNGEEKMLGCAICRNLKDNAKNF